MSYDVKDLFNARQERLPGYGYKLTEGGQYGQFGMDVVTDGDPEVDEQEMSFLLPYACGLRRDGVGDLVEIEGIDYSRHRLNPVSLIDHGKQVVLPLGKTENPTTGEYASYSDPVTKMATDRVWVYQGKGLANVDRGQEYDHAVLCEQIFDLWRQKFLRSGSLGYQVIDARPLEPDYIRGLPAGAHLLKVLKLESSVVVMPANMDTVSKMLSPGNRVCGKVLSPVLVKSLTLFVPAKTKTISGYEGKGLTEDEAAAKVEAQKSQLPHVREGMHQCGKCQKRYYTDAKASACCGNGVVRLRGKSLEVPVPMTEDLSETNTPPAVFEPGVGAKEIPGDLNWLKEEQTEAEHKAIRMKYRKKSDFMVTSDQAGGYVRWWVEDIMGNGQSAAGPFKTKEEAEARARDNEENRQRQLRERGNRRSPPWRKALPSDDISPEKAKEVLKDGEVHGHPLTEKQRGMFGAAAGKDKELKALRKKYRKGLGQGRAENIIYTHNVNERVQVGMKLTAREAIWVNGQSGNPGSKVASAGDKVRVVEITPDRMLRVENAAGMRALIHPTAIRKSLPQQGQKSWDVDYEVDVTKPNGDTVMLAVGNGQVEGDSSVPPAVRQAIAKNPQRGSMGSGGDVYRWEGHGKSLPTTETKSLDVRRKYRGAKSVRRRLKCSSPGSSLVHVGKKDIDNARTEAESKGVKFDEMGPVGLDAVKVKMTGDDGAIDALAQKFGKRIKSMTAYKAVGAGTVRDYINRAGVANPGDIKWYFDHHKDTILINGTPASHLDQIVQQGDTVSIEGRKFKSLNGEATHMAKELKREVKSAPDGLPEGGTDTALDAAPPEEVFSAQLGRRMHADHAHLMKDYDDLLRHNEHEGMGQAFAKVMEGLDANMSHIETAFGTHHKDLPPLEGAMDDEEEAEETDEGTEEEAPEEEADSGEEAPAEEVLDGETKGLKGKKKALPAKKKSVCPECGKENCTCGEKALTEDEADKVEEDIDAVGDELVEETEDTEPKAKGLEPHEVQHVNEAAGFMKELAQPDSPFEDEHRMKAYHHHKNLEPIGMEDDGDEYPMKAMDEVTEPLMDVLPEGDKAMHHRKGIAAASKYLKALSTERAFGDQHREEAALHGKALEGATNTPDPETEGVPDDALEGAPTSEEAAEDLEGSAEATFEPGEMGEKGLGRFGEIKPGDRFSHPAFGELTFVKLTGDPANTTEALFRDSRNENVTLKMTDGRLQKKSLPGKKSAPKPKTKSLSVEQRTIALARRTQEAARKIAQLNALLG